MLRNLALLSFSFAVLPAAFASETISLEDCRASAAGDERVVKNVIGGEGAGLGAALVMAQYKSSMKDVTDKFGRVLGKEVNARLKTDWSEPEFCGPQRYALVDLYCSRVGTDEKTSQCVTTCTLGTIWEDCR